MGRKKLCIATLDPANKGGVLTTASFVYKQAEKEGLKPVLVYNIIAGYRGSRERNTIGGVLIGLKPELHHERVDNMDCIGIERVLPEFEFFNYLLNIKRWKEALANCDMFFAVGGANICALPFALLNKNFSLWIGSTLLEDRIDRIRREPLVRRIRDMVSLPLLLYFEKLIFKKAKRILVISNYTRDMIMRKYKIDESKIDVAYYPINTARFQPSARNKKKDDYLLFTGRINDERKNIILLLSAFSILKKDYPSLKLRLVGEMPSVKLLRLVKELNIGDRVEFPGYVSLGELIREYQSAALFVIPSFQEGLCISALEAMACEIPVISTRCGGPEDFIQEGYNGYLVQNNNEKALVEAIKTFLNLSEKRKRTIAKNARDYIVNHYQPERTWRKLEKSFNA